MVWALGIDDSVPHKYCGLNEKFKFRIHRLCSDSYNRLLYTERQTSPEIKPIVLNLQSFTTTAWLFMETYASNFDWVARLGKHLIRLCDSVPFLSRSVDLVVKGLREQE
jgi:hypothetical protein